MAHIRSIYFVIAALLISTLVHFPAYASTCAYDYDDPPSQLLVAAVVAPKAYFQPGLPSCQNNETNCIGASYTRKGAYLIQGDNILILRTVGEYVCGSYTSKTDSQEVLGWLKKRYVVIDNHNNSHITGSWKGPGGSSAVFRQQGKIVIGEGESTWPAYTTGDRAMGVASFKGRVLRKSGFWTYNGGDCKVHFYVNAPGMIVTDNGSCGGMNARLNGRYRRN